jgi:hypothetical protein
MMSDVTNAVIEEISKWSYLNCWASY